MVSCVFRRQPVVSEIHWFLGQLTKYESANKGENRAAFVARLIEIMHDVHQSSMAEDFLAEPGPEFTIGDVGKVYDYVNYALYTIPPPGQSGRRVDLDAISALAMPIRIT